MCAEKSKDDVEQWVELSNFKDLDESPKYPRRRQLSEGSEPSPSSQFSTDVAISMPNTPLPPINTGSTTTDGVEAVSTSQTDVTTKRRLKFSGEPLNLSGTQQRPCSETASSSSSSTHHGTSKSPKSPRGKFFSSHSPSLTTPLSRSSSRYRDSESRGRDSEAKNRDVDIKTARGGQYSVAAKDASLLGRIAHKALKRNTRVLQPHEVFVELEELRAGDDSFFMEWEETARWIKFEEDVEADAGRWGRPHVSALAFHSLVDLRKSLEVGCILLDLEGDDFPSIADKIVEQLQETGQLPRNKVVFISQALYKRHKHQHHVTLWDDLRKAAKSADGTLHHLGDHLRHRHHNSHAQDTDHLAEVDESQQPHNAVNPLFDESTTVNLKSVSFAVRGSDDSIHKVDLDGDSKPLEEGNAKHSDASSLRDTREEPPHGLERNVSHPKLTASMQDLLKKIPDDAESITVLVGGVDFLNESVATFVRLEQSHLLGDLTEVPIPVRFIFLLLGPIQQMDYHEVGRAMATLMSDKCFHEVAYSATCKEDLLDGMDQFLDESIVLPPGDWDHELLLPLMHERNEIRRRREKKAEEEALAIQDVVDPMKCSRRPCGGIFADIKTLVKRYPSDIKDFFHTQCLLSILFTFISCIAPAITFGGLMGEVTHNAIGDTETLVGTGVCGMVFGLFSVQPLAILAFTGPLLLFEEIIIDFSETLSIEYLSWRACIGIWLMLFISICAIGELSFLVRKFTRFSEEIFTGVVTLFFTYEACRTLIGIFTRNPICGIEYPCGNYKNCSNTCNCSAEVDDYYTGSGVFDMPEMEENATLPTGFFICNQPNTSLWCLLLCFGTFFIAVMLRKLRQSRFLGKQGRRLVSDFGMLTAIVTMVTLAYIMRDRIPVERLVVASGLRPSDPTVRGWLINPLYNLKAVEIVGAAVPAALLATLIFIENQITLLLLNKPEHMLKKGVGYHFDLLLVALLSGVCGIFGLPWHCAASVRTIQHFQTLGVYSRKNAPGEKARLVNVYEQRVTNFMVHLFMFFSPFAYRLLREIPFSVVLGVFFYLAYASFSSIQLLKRVKLVLTPPKHHPDIHYVRKVRTWKMNMYTILQVLLIVTFYGLKLSPAGMIYPLAIVLLIPLRFLLGKYVFTHVEIEALDSEEDFPEDHHDKEADFPEYEETHAPY